MTIKLYKMCKHHNYHAWHTSFPYTNIPCNIGGGNVGAINRGVLWYLRGQSYLTTIYL